MLNIAHRGFSGKFPENTMLAFSEAIKEGVNMIEFDVQLSKDGHLMVIHDETLDRTTNEKGAVISYSRDELKQLDAGRLFSDLYAEEEIPDLFEMAYLPLGDVWLNLEIKKESLKLVEEGVIEEKVIEFLKESNLMGRTIVSSFDYRSLLKLRGLSSDVIIGVLTEKATYDMVEVLNLADKLNALSIHCDLLSLSDSLINIAHRRGKKVFVYTIDEPKDFALLKKAGVDGVFTNFPDIFNHQT